MDLSRGKALSTGDWIIGAAVCIGNKAYILGSESLFPERPAYHSMAIGAGLEDACITDRYEAAAYGWTEALDRYEEKFSIWIEVIPETVTRCCDKRDRMGNVLFEGDVYRNKDFLKFEICYGKYQAYLPEDKNYTENVGFFVVSDDIRRIGGSRKEVYNTEVPMPLGYTEDYAILLGNIFDNPKLRQGAGYDAGQDADQPTLRPAT